MLIEPWPECAEELTKRGCGARRGVRAIKEINQAETGGDPTMSWFKNDEEPDKKYFDPANANWESEMANRQGLAETSAMQDDV